MAPTVPPVVGGDVSVGLDGEPSGLDPAGTTASVATASVFSAIYEPLFSASTDGTVTPLLAESATPNADFTVWRLAVRPGVRFHDGTPLDAAAVIFNLTRQQQSPFNAQVLLPLQQLTELDALTVELTMAAPWVALPSVLAGVTGLMVSPTAAAGPDLARLPVGTGPYRLRTWDVAQQIVVERFDDYWQPDPAPLDTLTFRFFPVESARVAAFEAGEIDSFVTVTDATVTREQARGAQVLVPPDTGYGLLLLNTTLAPLDDVRVRRALEIGYDRDAVAEAFEGDGYADASFSPFVKGSDWWVASDSPPTFDPSGARELLDDYGRPVEFTVDLLAGSQEVEDSIRATIEYWNDVGMEVRLEVLPDVGSYITKALSRDFEAIVWLGSSTGDPDSVLYDLFHTGGAENLTGYSNPVVDAALDTGRSSADAAIRHEAYDTVQQQLRADQPVIIGSHNGIRIVADPDIGGLEPSSSFPSRTIRRTK